MPVRSHPMPRRREPCCCPRQRVRRFPCVAAGHHGLHINALRRDLGGEALRERQHIGVCGRVDVVIARLQRDAGISLKTLSVFILVGDDSRLPKPMAQAARATANERYEAFVAALGRRLARGQACGRKSPKTLCHPGTQNDQERHVGRSAARAGSAPPALLMPARFCC